MNPRYGMAEPLVPWLRPPVPSSSNNWPNSWICSARSLQNWELTLDTCAPESIRVVISCLSTITGPHSNAPLNEWQGQGWEKEQWWPLVILSFVPLSGWSVLVGVREGMLGAYYWLLWIVLVGIGAQSLGSPWTGLKFLLGWCIHKPCGPIPGTWSIGGNWGPSYLKCFPGYLCTLGNSVPGLDLWSLCHDQQICCKLRQSVPGQFDHCGSWCDQERSFPVCPSPPMASLCGAIWGTARAVVLSCSGQGGHQLGYLVS